MKIAVIGQSLFGQEVYNHLKEEGHKVVGVFTVPDQDGKVDPLGEWLSRKQSLRGLLWGRGLPWLEAASGGPPCILLRCQLAEGLFWNKVECGMGFVSWRRPACSLGPAV